MVNDPLEGPNSNTSYKQLMDQHSQLEILEMSDRDNKI